jgi:hypothetical protein
MHVATVKILSVVNENQLQLFGGRPEIKKTKNCESKARLQSITLDT